jgi:hypothetical protein
VREPLLGDADLWEQWFALSGLKVRVNPVAVFNDAGLMLQAAEQNIGISLSREVLAADALRERRLFRLSSLALHEERVDAYWLVYPPALHDWRPLASLRRWLHEQIDASARAWSTSDASPLSHSGGAALLPEPRGKRAGRPSPAQKALKPPAGKAAAGRTESRSPARSAAAAKRRSMSPRARPAAAPLDARQRQTGALDEQVGGKPSRNRNALSMNSKANASRATSCSLLTACPASACFM